MEKKSQDIEQMEVEEKRKSPLTMAFILWNVFSDRFSTAGAQTILAMYFNVKLHLDPTMATALYHVYELLFLFFTIIGAVMADSWLGHYKAILLMQTMFGASALIIGVGNIAPLNLSLPLFTLLGLLLMVISQGSVRVNLSVFGADQYKLPEQSATYLTYSYLFLKFGSVVARTVVPILRQDVQCFGASDCYPLAFGSLAVMMITGSVLLVCGSSKYSKKPPSGNMLFKVCGCIVQGVIGKIRTVWSRTVPKSHWLDYSEDKYGSEVVADTKAAFNILLVYLSLPLYWAVYVQQPSRWTFQASRMNGDLFFFSIKPDQMIVFNSIFTIAMLPVCNFVLYPLLARVGIKTYLHKMALGGALAACSFIASGLVEIKIQSEFIHMLWLIPQYLFMATGENFLYVALVAFAYSEAPPSIKSAMQAFMFMTIAVANVIVSSISGSKIFSSLPAEHFFYAGALIVNQIIFAYLSSNYKSVHSAKPATKESLLKK